MTPLIIETLLIYHFEVFCVCQTVSYHIHLIFIHQYDASIDAYQHTQNQLADISFWSISGMRNQFSPQTPGIYESTLLLLWMSRYKNQPHTYSHSWDITHLSFWSSLGMTSHVGTQPPGIYESNYCFYGCLPNCSWNIADLLFRNSLDVPNYARPHPYDLYEPIHCFPRCLPEYKKSTTYINLFLRCWTFKNSAIWFVEIILGHSTRN